MTKQISLTQGQVALVDDEDYEYLNQWKWNSCWNKYTQSFYAQRNATTPEGRTTIQMSRDIMNTPRGLVCDHINHDTLDNQKHNLRNATFSQNNSNRKVDRDNVLGEKNIHKHGKGYRVSIIHEGSKVYNKTFRTLEDAIQIRNIEIRKIHGEFAYTGDIL